MFKIFSKIFQLKSKDSKIDENSDNKNSDNAVKKENIIPLLHQKTESLINFVKNKTFEIKEDISQIKYKMSNLLETNYKLGLKHIEKGNISDAIFRFRFIKKFWPNFPEAYYYLAYCLLINKKQKEATLILKELVEKYPKYTEKAKELVSKVNEAQE